MAQNKPKQKQTNSISLPEAKRIIPEYKALGLTAKQLLFVAYYVSNGHNATQAYLSLSGAKKMSYNVAGNRASDTIKDPKIQKAILFWFDRWLSERKTALEKEIIDVYYRRAFYPLNVFFHDDKTPRNLSEIPKEWHCCIDGIDKKIQGQSEQEVHVFRLANREKALDQLAKYMGMFAENVVMQVNLSEGAQARMDKIFSTQTIPFPQKGKAG